MYFFDLIAELCLLVARQLKTDSSMLVWYSVFIPRHHGGIDEHIALTLAEWNNAHVVDLWHCQHRQIISEHVALLQFIEELLHPTLER